MSNSISGNGFGLAALLRALNVDVPTSVAPPSDASRSGHRSVRIFPTKSQLEVMQGFVLFTPGAQVPDVVRVAFHIGLQIVMHDPQGLARILAMLEDTRPLELGGE
jgi:hypothetical protein